MAYYYNKSRGPVALTLRSGQTISVPPKSWVELTPRDEGSASVIDAVKRDDLVRKTVLPANARGR